MSPNPVLNVTERQQQPPTVAVSTVIFALQPPAGHPIADGHHERTHEGLWVPLVRRIRAPFSGVWALPGGPLAWNHSLEQSARETSASIIGTSANFLEQLYTFGGIERSATDLRQVTIAYWMLLGLDQHPRIADTDNLAWFPADALPPLAFDHAEIIAVARERLRAKSAYADIAGRFLGAEFTLAELRRVHDAVLGTVSDPANFRRRMLASGQLAATGGARRDGAHRPAQLFRFALQAPPPAKTAPDETSQLA